MATEKGSSLMQAASTHSSSSIPGAAGAAVQAAKYTPKTIGESFSGSHLAMVRRRESDEPNWNNMRVNGSLLPMRRLQFYAFLCRVMALVGRLLSGR
jgi:hypothetical protein